MVKSYIERTNLTWTIKKKTAYYNKCVCIALSSNPNLQEIAEPWVFEATSKRDTYRISSTANNEAVKKPNVINKKMAVLFIKDLVNRSCYNFRICLGLKVQP